MGYLSYGYQHPVVGNCWFSLQMEIPIQMDILRFSSHVFIALSHLLQLNSVAFHWL